MGFIFFIKYIRKSFSINNDLFNSTSLDPIDGETGCKWDSAVHLVSYFFTPWLVSYSWQQPTLLHSACNFVAISNTVFSPPWCSVEMLSDCFDVCVFSSVAVLCTHLREPVFNLYQNVFKMKHRIPGLSKITDIWPRPSVLNLDVPDFY